MALLALSAPQLRSLCHQYPDEAPENPASALPATLRQLSQLTRLRLRFGLAPVTAAQVDRMVQGLPSLQHLKFDGGGDGWSSHQQESARCEKDLWGVPVSR